MNYLKRQTILDLRGQAAGDAFEHFIYMELYAYNQLTDKDQPITYWRTKGGLEVDFIIGRGEIALEVKLSSQVKKENLKGLIAFAQEHQPKRLIVVSQDAAPRRLTEGLNTPIEILPWQDFLRALWANEILV